MSLLLNVDFMEYILAPQRIAGLSLIIVGIALAFLAKKLARVIKRESEVDKCDKTYVTILTIAFVMILGGMIIAIL